MAKIYQNRIAGYETYFVPLYPARSARAEPSKVGGFRLTCINGRWRCAKAEYYKQTLEDKELFPVVGEVKIDIYEYVKNEILNALEGKTDV